MITVENASELGKRSVQLRRERKELAQQHSNSGVLTVLPTDLYPLHQLVHVREQIRSLSKTLSEMQTERIGPDGVAIVTDPKDIAYIVKSISTLREDERRYAGRPLPGKASTPKRVASSMPVPE